MTIEAIKKTQMKGILEMENLGKRTGTTDTSITNRIQDMEEIFRHRKYHRASSTQSFLLGQTVRWFARKDIKS